VVNVPAAVPAAIGGTAVVTAPAAPATATAPAPAAVPLPGRLALLLATAATMLAIVFAGPLFDLAQRAAEATLR
jgi:hypothetical protein